MQRIDSVKREKQKNARISLKNTYKSRFLRTFAAAAALTMLLAASGCTREGALVEGSARAVTAIGEYIYYINGIGSTPGKGAEFSVRQGALCRMRSDGTNREVIVPACVAGYQLAGNDIFLVWLSSDNTYSVGVCGLDGSELKRIDTMEKGAFQYYYGYLYYQAADGFVRTDSRGGSRRVVDERAPGEAVYARGRLWCTFADAGSGKASFESMKPDGSDKKVIADYECAVMGRGEDGIYYLSSADSVLYRLDCRSGKSEKMIFTQYDYYLADDKTRLAYCAGGEASPGLTEHNMANGEKRRLNDYYCKDPVKTEEYIYFINASDNSFLYRSRISDGATELVSATVPVEGRTYVLDGYIYYISAAEKSRIYRIDEKTLERVCVQYGV